MCNLTENFLEDYLQDLRLDAEYLDWKRDQELRAWQEFVEQKEEEEKAYDIMAERHFRMMEMVEQEQLELV
jgi:hypothetical protein